MPPNVKAGDAWYGRLVGAKRTETLSHPVDVARAKHDSVLGLYGTEDPGISPESIREMHSRLAAGRQLWEIVPSPGALHGFTPITARAIARRRRRRAGIAC